MAKRGPKPFSIDPDEVRHLASLGCTREEIAAILSDPKASKLLNPEHLERKYRAVFTKGRMELHRNLRSELVDRALNGNIAALIFALKHYCKMGDSDANNPDERRLTIHFDYNQAKDIENRAIPVREAVRDMLSNYRKDYNNTTEESVMEVESTPLLTDSEPDSDLTT